MRLSIFPRDVTFYDLFTRQAECICEMSDLFHDLVHNYENLEEKLQRIHQLERKGDELYSDISRRVASTFVTPLDREDIHRLADHLDDILDYIQAAAARMHLFRVDRPLPKLLQMADLVPRCAEVLKAAIHRLPRFEDLSELRQQMHDYESRGDWLNREAVAELFEGCREVGDVVDLIKWKEIIETTENALDRFEDVFDVLETVVIKHS